MENYKPISFKALGTLAVLGFFVLFAGCTPGQQAASSPDNDDAIGLTRIPAGQLDYYPAGEYLRNGYPAVPPRLSVQLGPDLMISTRQVSQAQYALCVKDGACKPLDRPHRDQASADLPAVGVSWRDATAYAQWLSKETGAHYRLPTYEEWVYAAGDAYKEDVLLEEFDVSNPAKRWLAEYALETQRKTSVDGALRPFGGFGVNNHGLLDVAGNVWDWTDTCHVRAYLDSDHDSGVLRNENCGVRVVAGAHRSYIPDFIRDAKSGACSVGVPPSNLGFRLVRDDSAPQDAPGASLRERLGLG